MTFDEIRSNVQQWLLNRPEIDTTLRDSVINKVYLSLATPFRFHEVETETKLSMVAGTRDYALPSSTLYALRDAYDSWYGRPLDVVDINQLDRRLETELYEGTPTKIARYGEGVRLDIAPNYTEADSLVLRGIKLPTPLSDGADVPVYPADWHWVIELQASSILSFMYGMEERGQLLQNIAMGQLAGRQEPHTIEAFTKQLQLVTGTRRRSYYNDADLY